MENPGAGRFTATALMLGNLVTGCSVLAPAGMLPELSTGLDTSIHAAGLLITFGAITLCIGSPLTAWLTSRIERRLLLTPRSRCWRWAISARPLRLITRASSSFAW